MTVRVGVIGTGMIGQDHIRRITHVLSGGEVVAVTDVDAARAGQVAARLPAAAVHEIALVRRRFGEDIVATNILKPGRSSKGGAELHDPLIVLLEMASGVLVDVEVFVNATYGYDIRGEIVGERGTVALADTVG